MQLHSVESIRLWTDSGFPDSFCDRHSLKHRLYYGMPPAEYGVTGPLPLGQRGNTVWGLEMESPIDSERRIDATLRPHR